VQLRLGRPDEATETARLVMANERATLFMRFPAMVTLTKLRTRRGEPAAELLEELSRFLETAMELQRLAPYAVLVAERAWLGQADREEALGLLAKAEAMAFEPVMASEVYYWQHLLGADHITIKADGLLEPFRLLLSGDWQGAADIWLALGAPHEQALALLEGDHRARLHALTIFESLGATAVAEHVRKLIRQRGERITTVGPRASTRANPAGLTKRQMDVLRLIDQGLSNSEIAEKLFISAKTVDHHVSTILGKLDAKSRGESAAIARKVGLIG
jgi:DNA-binding CsgD family transcriptional regulator